MPNNSNGNSYAPDLGRLGAVDPGQGSAPISSAEPPQRTYVTGMTVALGGMLMFFMALVSAYIVRKGFPNSDWRSLNVPRILWLNTLILVASSATLERARRLLAESDEEGFRHWWGVTAILGAFFLAGQVIAWRQLAAAGLYLTTNPSASFLYVFTAAHALHLLGGIGGLLAVLFLQPRRLTLCTASEVAAMYWHFMDGLWAFLFLLLLLGR